MNKKLQHNCATPKKEKKIKQRERRILANHRAEKQRIATEEKRGLVN